MLTKLPDFWNVLFSNLILLSINPVLSSDYSYSNPLKIMKLTELLLTEMSESVLF